MVPPLPSLVRSESEPRIALARLVRMRWVALAGQLATLALAGVALALQLPWLPLLGLLALTAATNLAAVGWLGLGKQVSTRHVGVLLALDVLLLTGLLYLTGGSSNPFGVLYLVHVTLAAVVLRPAASISIAALALGCYGLLFSGGVPVPELEHAHHGDARAFTLHLQGMWVANAVAASLIGWFTTEMRRALRAREAELERSRLRSSRLERLAAMGTLAAGAAHELGTPLGTIAVAAREMERTVDDPALREDSRLIREQVDRCQEILRHLGRQAGVPGGEELAPAPVATIVARVLDGLAPERRRRVTVDLPEALAPSLLPGGVLARALRDLLGNAFDASAPDAPVEVRIRTDGVHVELAVVDRGTGMAPEVLAHAGEPFFTTKEPGRGMGLGLHLARTIAEQLGGGLTLRSRPGEGTEASLRLPWRAA